MSKKPVLQDPLIAQRNPFELFLLSLAAITGVTTLATGVAASKSMEITLDATTLYIWAWSLTIGCVTAMLGILMPHRARFVEVGLQLERFGLVLTGTGVAIFVYVVISANGWLTGGQVAASNLAFALACFTRTLQITRRFRYANTWRRPERGRPSDRGK